MVDFNEKSKAAYNKKADGYDSSPEGQFTRRLQLMLVSEMAWRENDAALDVACGNGSLLEYVNRQKPVSGFGVDISDQMIKNASARNPGMEFHVSGCETLPFPSGSMDLITVCSAYHHFPDPAAFASEAKRVLKPKGMAYIVDMYFPFLLKVLLNPFVPLLKDGDFRFYSPKEILRNFERFGFEKTSVKIYGHIQVVSMQKNDLFG
ncbi:MAG: methyltransferase domain-containing protein [Clostridiales bacterium]|nr:methyltransferase domain-containing protein [Clostridiales bacterium]